MDEFFQKITKGDADNSILLRWIHTVTMELDKQPVWTPMHVNSAPASKRKTVKAHRIRGGDRGVFQNQSPGTDTAIQVRKERTLDDEREPLRRGTPDNQIDSLALRRCLF